MKWLLFAIFGLLGSLTAAAQITPMEMRIIQTRLFEKPPREVYNALSSLCNDMSLQAGGIFSQGGLQCLNIGMPDYKQGWTGKIKIKPGQIFRIQFSCEQPCDVDADKKTVVRTRIHYYGEKVNEHVQSVDPADYSKIFDQIGQYLFIEAIEWTPNVQH
tara:strand:+ start:2223 stop:2699 length:477 start_codon:yes stop_codon:yes gene_type:complete